MEWYEKYKEASKAEVLAQALEACSRRDCAHCLYQGMGIKCRVRLMQDAAAMLIEMQEKNG
ncbi:hypothetical protein D1646_21145 [Pseudoflavonifractor sp. 60]|uniref:hypothetical protein n=1 Tax=Pseudoflavonifractor sp. 60 TaxID=2304576 RepID=UPI001371A6AE|nr:hypothetical protein [Pseudoflavonifractor sp. 60]NBI69239.1 hypothetical protein [Pseudoflavonifractor sp. 60]